MGSFAGDWPLGTGFLLEAIVILYRASDLARKSVVDGETYTNRSCVGCFNVRN